jgi:hypothetical protein
MHTDRVETTILKNKPQINAYLMLRFLKSSLNSYLHNNYIKLFIKIPCARHEPLATTKAQTLFTAKDAKNAKHSSINLCELCALCGNALIYFQDVHGYYRINHRVHRGHREKSQPSVLSVSSVVENSSSTIHL